MADGDAEWVDGKAYSKYLVIFGLLSFLLRQQLEENSSSKNSAFVSVKLVDYVYKCWVQWKC